LAGQVPNWLFQLEIDVENAEAVTESEKAICLKLSPKFRKKFHFLELCIEVSDDGNCFIVRRLR
jgi:hypothetical protein